MYRIEKLQFPLVFALAAACTVAPDISEISEQNQEIIGGIFFDGFPEIGLIQNGTGSCTGTLISPTVVLTAAHCIDNSATTFFISEGEGPEQVFIAAFEVDKQFGHSEFVLNNLRGGHDIGALVLKEAVPPEIATPMAFLRDPLDQSFIGQSFLAVGYGISNPAADFPDNGSGVKRSVNLSVDFIQDEFYDYGDSQKNICQGDSGGPDIIDINGVNTIIGVHSFGDSGCRGSSSSTRVDIHLDAFIQPILEGRAPEVETSACEADGVCIGACGLSDPDCECRSDGFCQEVCSNGVGVDPDCCGADAACNEACSANGLVDNDCFGGACTISPELSAQNPNSPYGILFSLFGIIVFGFFTLRRRS